MANRKDIVMSTARQGMKVTWQSRVVTVGTWMDTQSFGMRITTYLNTHRWESNWVWAVRD
jgi:hypothetical protein